MKEPIYQSVVQKLGIDPEKIPGKDHWSLPALKRRILQDTKRRKIRA